MESTNVLLSSAWTVFSKTPSVNDQVRLKATIALAHMLQMIGYEEDPHAGTKIIIVMPTGDQAALKRPAQPEKLVVPLLSSARHNGNLKRDPTLNNAALNTEHAPAGRLLPKRSRSDKRRLHHKSTGSGDSAK